MTDNATTETTQGKILALAFGEIPFSGFTDETLHAAAMKAGIPPDEMKAAFPRGTESLLSVFSEWADDQMQARMQSEQPERLRDRITLAVRARIEALVPHKEAARRATTFLALPQHAVLAAKLLFRSVDAMWRAAGDKSSNFSYYSKRGTLAGVYGATLLYWLSDSSDGNSATWSFLERRIGDVMQFEKIKADAQNTFGKFPDPMRILDALRTRRR